MIVISSAFEYCEEGKLIIHEIFCCTISDTVATCSYSVSIMDAFEKQRKLQLVYGKINHVISFLVPYLPLANAHNSDFIMCQHWENLVPSSLADELLSLDDQQLCLLPSGKLFTDAGSLTEHVVSGTIEKIAEDSTFNPECADCQKLVTSGSQRQISCEHKQHDCTEPVAADEQTQLVVSMPNNSDVKNSHLPLWHRTLVPTWTHNNLADFVFAARSNSLPELGVLTSVEELRSCLKLVPDMDHMVISNFMNSKKSYEVDIMTALCAELAKRFSLANVSKTVQTAVSVVNLSILNFVLWPINHICETENLRFGIIYWY